MAFRKEFVGFIAGLVCAGVVGFVGTTTAESSGHRPDPTRASGPCQAEADAYDAADAAALAAEEAANAALEAWQDCEEGGQHPIISADPGTKSILIK